MANILHDTAPNARMRRNNIIAQLLLQPGDPFTLHTLRNECDQHQNIAEPKHEPNQHEHLIHCEINAERSFLHHKWKFD